MKHIANTYKNQHLTYPETIDRGDAMVSGRFEGVDVMIPGRDQYVMRTREGWAVMEDGIVKPFGVFTRKQEAVRLAEERALRHHGYLVLYNIDGTIWMRNC